MSNWVKFSERLPTEADANQYGWVIVLRRDDEYAYSSTDAMKNPDRYTEFCWLEGVPSLPKPRTLEDVVRDYLADANWNEPWEQRYRDEMLEILERSCNE